MIEDRINELHTGLSLRGQSPWQSHPSLTLPLKGEGTGGGIASPMLAMTSVTIISDPRWEGKGLPIAASLIYSSEDSPPEPRPSWPPRWAQHESPHKDHDALWSRS